MPKILPPEILAAHGRPSERGELVETPPQLRCLTPLLDVPEDADPKAYARKIAEETSEFLFEKYGLGSKAFSLDFGIYAEAIETWLLCRETIAERGQLVKNNRGEWAKNPAYAIRKQAETTIHTFHLRYGIYPSNSLTTQQRDDAGGVKRTGSAWLDELDNENDET